MMMMMMKVLMMMMMMMMILMMILMMNGDHSSYGKEISNVHGTLVNNTLAVGKMI